MHWPLNLNKFFCVNYVQMYVLCEIKPLSICLVAEDDDEIMGDDGLLGGTTSVDDLKIAGNISTSTNSSIIGGQWSIFAIFLFKQHFE